MLAGARRPLTGADLAEALGVSRQVVVQDIAILRAAGRSILATPRGYLPDSALAPAPVEAVLAVRHSPAQSNAELTALVDAGCRVVDVAVDHPLYGELRGNLLLESRADIDDWTVRARASQAHMLSELTDGLHLHTVRAATGEAIERGRAALRTLGCLVEETEGTRGGRQTPAPRASARPGASATPASPATGRATDAGADAGTDAGTEEQAAAGRRPRRGGTRRKA